MYGDKGEVPDGEYIIPLGVAEVKRKGDDVTIVTFGKIYHTVVKAAEELEQSGISVEIVDLRTVRPIDYDTVFESVRKTNRLVIVEEAWPLASISTEIAYKVQREAFDHLDAPIERVTMRDVPMSYAANMVEATLPNKGRIIDAVNAVTYTK